MVFGQRRSEVSMSLRRWAGTTALMAAVAWALGSLGPGVSDLQAALADPQGLVDRSGPDALLLAVVPALGWVCWGWGALGLLLTAASAVPGGAGRLAGLLLPGAVRGGARGAAALALGLGLSPAGRVVLPPGVAPPLVSTAAAADDVGDGLGQVV